MMDWKIRHISTKDQIRGTFSDRDAAVQHIQQMVPALSRLFEAIPINVDPWQFKILTEGLVAGDLRHIILPQISIDEYVPSDTESDNIVIAFFIKGVPEAVIPFRDFINKCSSVLDVSYGDSDTVPDTSIVYAEMARKQFKVDDLHDLLEQVSMLCNLEISDFSLMFPSSSERYPYSTEVVQQYFAKRAAKKNWQAQQDAIKSATKRDDSANNDVRESLISRMIDLI